LEVFEDTNDNSPAKPFFSISDIFPNDALCSFGRIHVSKGLREKKGAKAIKCLSFFPALLDHNIYTYPWYHNISPIPLSYA